MHRPMRGEIIRPIRPSRRAASTVRVSSAWPTYCRSWPCTGRSAAAKRESRAPTGRQRRTVRPERPPPRPGPDPPEQELITVAKTGERQPDHPRCVALRRAVEAAGVSAFDLGCRLGVKRGSAHQHASGWRVPSLDWLAEASLHLGCKPSDLDPWLADRPPADAPRPAQDRAVKLIRQGVVIGTVPGTQARHPSRRNRRRGPRVEGRPARRIRCGGGSPRSTQSEKKISNFGQKCRASHGSSRVPKAPANRPPTPREGHPAPPEDTDHARQP